MSGTDASDSDASSPGFRPDQLVGFRIGVTSDRRSEDLIAAFEREFELASSLGARQILFWEADYIDDRANAAELKKAMSARSQPPKH